MRHTKAKTVALHGILLALALVLSWAEAQIPAFFAVPGMKLGLTNLVVVIALYLLGWKSAMGVNLLRVVLVGLLFGNGMSFFYSLAGGLLSGLIMILLKKTGKFSLVVVSVMGGIFHNVGQVLCAMVILRTAALGWYLAILWFTGLVSGAVIGILSGLLCRRLEHIHWGRDGK